MDWDANVCDRSPLFWPVRPHARVFRDHRQWPSVAEYDRVFAGAAPVRFAPSAPRPRRRRREPVDPRRLYDGLICEERLVQTRPASWHDFFNALVWAAFPRTKARLHARQHRAIAARVAPGAAAQPGARTREQDGLALLDEGGVVLLCAANVADDVRRALDLREVDPIAGLTREGRVLGVVYGHAIYEHVGCGGPRVRATAHVVGCPVVPADAGACVDLCDAALSEALADPSSFARPEDLRSLPADPQTLGFR